MCFTGDDKATTKKGVSGNWVGVAIFIVVQLLDVKQEDPGTKMQVFYA